LQPTSDSVGINLPFLHGGWVRVITGDGELFDVPQEALATAKYNDPNLRVIATGIVNKDFQR
jgi:hypothetical protein